jgi:alcohol dehydrogenase (cytochrome c)
VFSAPAFLGAKNWMPMAYSPQTGLFYVPANEWGMDIWNEPITYKKGAAFLGAGFTIKPLYRRLHRRAARDRSDHRQDRLGIQERRAAVGRRDDHRGQPGVLPARRKASEGVRCEDRQGAVEVPDRLRRGRRRRSPGQDGEQYVAVVSGWGGAVPLWGGEVAKKVNFISRAARSGCSSCIAARPPRNKTLLLTCRSGPWPRL